MNSRYVASITSLTLLIVAVIAVWITITWIGLAPRDTYDRGRLVDISGLTPMETVEATGIGTKSTTITLTPGIWLVELAINTDEYDGVQLQSVEPGRSASTWWSGETVTIVVNDIDRVGGVLYSGATRVSVGALPGHT